MKCKMTAVIALGIPVVGCEVNAKNRKYCLVVNLQTKEKNYKTGYVLRLKSNASFVRMMIFILCLQKKLCKRLYSTTVMNI